MKDKLLKTTDYLADRLAERSTWYGIISLATSFGVSIPWIHTESAIAVGTATAGLVAALIPDRK